jgi:hypothetical protein
LKSKTTFLPSTTIDASKRDERLIQICATLQSHIHKTTHPAIGNKAHPLPMVTTAPITAPTIIGELFLRKLVMVISEKVEGLVSISKNDLKADDFHHTLPHCSIKTS